MNEKIGLTLIVIGVLFDLLGCVGLVRLPDVYNRIQASTKCGGWEQPRSSSRGLSVSCSYRSHHQRRHMRWRVPHTGPVYHWLMGVWLTVMRMTCRLTMVTRRQYCEKTLIPATQGIKAGYPGRIFTCIHNPLPGIVPWTSAFQC